MSAKMSEVDWDNDEAVVRAAVPSAFKGHQTGWIWAWGNIRYKMGESWTIARQYPTVVAFERYNRRESEVQEDKKTVIAAYEGQEVECRNIKKSWCIYVLGELIGYSVVSEDAAWQDAKSKLTPAAVAGDAVKEMRLDCDEFMEYHRTSGQHRDGINPYTNEEIEDISSWNTVADPVGEREGEFEKWWADLNSGEIQVIVGHVEPYARAAWNASLASKQSAEGIPERPKATGNFGGNLACNVHDVYSYCDKVEAIISANEAEIAEWRSVSKLSFGEFYHRISEALTLLQPIDPGVGPNTFVALVPRLVSELASLKLSSVRIEEAGKVQGLRLAFDAVISVGEIGSKGLCSKDEIEKAILALIPTSPESQEEGE